MAVELRTLRVSAEMDAGKYVAGANQKVAADRAMTASSQGVGAAVQQSETKISQAGDVLARLSRQYVDGYASAQRMQSAVNSLSRGIDAGKITMAQAEPILDGIFRKYGQLGDGAQFAAKGQHEFAAAITNTTARLSAQVVAANAAAAATSRVSVAANQNVAANTDQGLRQGNFNSANIAAQFQDIAVTSAMGMSPLQIALQQGTQLSAVLGPMGAAGAAKSLGSALLSVVSPASLITLALVGGTAAAIQYFSSSKKEVKTLDDALKVHEQSIARVSELWGEAAVARSKYGTTSTGSVAFGIEGDIAELQRQVRKAATVEMGLLGTSSPITDALKKSINDNLKATGLTEDQFQQTPLFQKIEQDWLSLSQNINEGGPAILTIIEGIETVGRTSANSGLRAMAQDAATALQPFRKLAEALRDAAIERDRLFNNVGPNGMLLSQGMVNRADMGNLALFQSQEAVAAARRQQSTDATLLGIGARSPAERAAAAKAAAAAEYNDSETAAARRDRIETAGKLELARATHALTEALQQRARSLDQTLAQQQLEISLIGQTAGETARLRMEFEQISQIREEAARNGVEADEKEIAAIKAKAEAYGKFADEIARANFARELAFERDQMFRSPQDQQIASRLQGAGLAVDLNSPEAQQMRDNNRFAEYKELATGFLGTFKSEMMASGGDIGESLGKAILNALSTSMDWQLEMIFDRLATAFAAAMTGARPGAAAGSVAASAFGTTGGFADMLSFGGANDNYAPGAVTRAPLGAVGDMAGYIQQAAIARGIDADIALRVARSEGLAPGVWQSNATKNGIREPSYGPFQLLKGGAGTGYPAGMGNDFMRMTGLDPADPANARAGVDFALDGAAKNGWGAWYGAKAAGIGNWEGLAGANPIGVGAEKASAALDKMSTNAITASQNLGGLGTSVDGAVKALTGSLGGAGGGLASILEGLKPANFQANTSLSAILGYGGAAASAPAAGGAGGGLLSMLLGFIPGLFGFAGGTDFAPGGLARINEGNRGEIVDLPRGSRVIPHDVSMRMAANANRPAQSSKVELHVHLTGASGDEHVRTLAKQGAQEAIGQYHEAQSRGGFGELQRQYASQKG